MTITKPYRYIKKSIVARDNVQS